MPGGSAQTKAFFRPEKGPDIACLFNPAQLTITRSNSWGTGKRGRLGVPVLAYLGANAGSMSFDVFFDTTDTGEPVTRYTDALMRLLDVDPTLSDSDRASDRLRPPTVTFHWGDLQSFAAVIKSLTVNLVYFAADGKPLRAKATITLDQCDSDSEADLPAQNPTSGTPWPHTVHRVSPGETLDRIAVKHYADPNAWRVIAEANDIRDPLSVPAGTLLAIPGRSA
jgi:hypothetical protein